MLEQAIIDYFKSDPEVAAVYLFGSHATGKNRPISDVDLGILLMLECKTSDHELKDKYIIQLGRILRKDIHPVIMNRSNEVLLKQIMDRGKCILLNDAEFHHQFKAISITKIIDYNFYLKQFHSALKKKVMKDE